MKTPKRNYMAGFVLIFTIILAFTACDNSADSPTDDPPELYTVPADIEFSGFSNDAINLSEDRENDISKSRGGTLVVTVAGQFDSYAWYINGTAAPASWVSGNRITLDAGLETLPVGAHILTAVVTKGRIPYSKVLTFRVVW